MTQARGSSPGRRVRRLWKLLRGMPGGRWLFSRLLGWMIPYTGTIGARVEALEPGYARLGLRDRRRVRNHLGSVHAVALANLGEVTSGLAMTLALPPRTRGIVTRLTVDYHRKARGRLLAESRVELPPIRAARDVTVRTHIRDADGELVAEATVIWRVEPHE